MYSTEPQLPRRNIKRTYDRTANSGECSYTWFVPRLHDTEIAHLASPYLIRLDGCFATNSNVDNRLQL